MQVAALEQDLTEANKRLTRIDEADKRLGAAPASSAATSRSEPAVKFESLPGTKAEGGVKP